MRRLFLPAVAALFAALTLATSLHAETSGDWIYRPDFDNEATILYYIGAGGAVTIPSVIDGKLVKRVGGGGQIFLDNNVTSVTIPNSVTTVENRAFASCTGLTSVNIPNSVTAIGIDAFQNCIGLTSVIVDAANPAFASVSGVLFNKALTSLLLHPVSKQGVYDIPNSVTTIEDAAFQSCIGLTSQASRPTPTYRACGRH